MRATSVQAALEPSWPTQSVDADHPLSFSDYRLPLNARDAGRTQKKVLVIVGIDGGSSTRGWRG